MLPPAPCIAQATVLLRRRAVISAEVSDTVGGSR